MNLWKLLKRCISNLLWHKRISSSIAENEPLVRGILHPHFYSQSENKVKREAFLPPPNRNDVSLLRLSYTTVSFCKNHSASLKIGDSKYCGLAIFLNKHIEESRLTSKIGSSVFVKATPIDENGNYSPGNMKVYTTTPGLPMHADLLYEKPLTKGEVQTEYRKFANEIIKVVKYYQDPNPEISGWLGEKVEWKKAI